MNPYAPMGSDSIGNNAGIPQGTPFYDTGSLVSSMPYTPGMNADGSMLVPSPWASQITQPSSSNFRRELFIKADRAAKIISRANTSRRAEGIWNVVDYLPNQRLEKAGWVEQQVSWYLPSTTAVGDYGHGGSPSVSITGKSSTSRKVSLSWTQGMRSMDLNEGKQFWLRMVALLHVSLKLEEEAMAFAMLLGTASMPTCLFDHDAASRDTYSLDEAMRNFEEQFALLNKNSHSGLPTLTGEVRKRFGFMQTEQPENFAMFVSPNSILLFLNTKTAAVNYEESGPRSGALLKMQGTDNAPDLQGAKIYKCEHRVENAGRGILERNIPLGWRVDQQEPYSKSCKVYFVGTDREEEIPYSSALKHITEHYFDKSGKPIPDLFKGTEFAGITDFKSILKKGELTMEMVYGWFEYLSNNHPKIFKGFCEKFVDFKFEPANLGPNDAVELNTYAPKKVTTTSFFTGSKFKRRSTNVDGKAKLEKVTTSGEQKSLSAITEALAREQGGADSRSGLYAQMLELTSIKGQDFHGPLLEACKYLQNHVQIEGKKFDVTDQFDGELAVRGKYYKYFLFGDAADNTENGHYLVYPSLILACFIKFQMLKQKFYPFLAPPIEALEHYREYFTLMISPAFNDAVVTFLEGVKLFTEEDAKNFRLLNDDQAVLIDNLAADKGDEELIALLDDLSTDEPDDVQEAVDKLYGRLGLPVATKSNDEGQGQGGGNDSNDDEEAKKDEEPEEPEPEPEPEPEVPLEPKKATAHSKEPRQPMSVIFDRDVPTIAEAVQVYLRLPFTRDTLESLNMLRIPLPFRIVLLSPGVVYRSNAILVAPENRGVATLAVSNTTTRYQKDEYQLQEFCGVEMDALAHLSKPEEITEFPCPFIEGVSRGDHPEFYTLGSSPKSETDYKIAEVFTVKPGKRSYLFAGFSSWAKSEKSKWSTLIGHVKVCKKSPFYNRLEHAEGALFPFGKVIYNKLNANKMLQRKLADFEEGNASNIGIMPLVAFALCRTTHHEISGITGAKTTHEDSSLFPSSWGTGSRTYRTGTTGSNTHTVRRFSEIPF